MTVNSVVLGGNLTRNPELRTTASGQSCMEFTVAVNGRKKVGAEWVDDPSYIDCEMWGDRAVWLSERMRKGDRVTVQGRLKQHRWQAKDGTNRSKVAVSASEVQLMAGARDDAPTAPRQAEGANDVYALEDVPF